MFSVCLQWSGFETLQMGHPPGLIASHHLLCYHILQHQLSCQLHTALHGCDVQIHQNQKNRRFAKGLFAGPINFLGFKSEFFVGTSHNVVFSSAHNFESNNIVHQVVVSIIALSALLFAHPNNVKPQDAPTRISEHTEQSPIVERTRSTSP